MVNSIHVWLSGFSFANLYLEDAYGYDRMA